MSNDPGGAASRRSFLKAIGGALGAAALPVRNAVATAPENDTDYDVIVVGGGFAGVTAARELGHAGLRTLILEARNRLGGRTFTTRVDGELFELGGTWIHSTQPHAFAEATRYGLDLVETSAGLPQQVLWWDGERAREAGVWELTALVREALCASGEGSVEAPLSVLEAFSVLSGQMVDFHAGAAAAFPRPFDPFSTTAWHAADSLSIRDRLDQLDLSSDRAALLEGVLGASAHGDFSQASFVEMLRWWALSGNDLNRYADSVARYRFRDGTSSLIDAMVDDGRPDVRLGTHVSEVSQAGERVEVRTERGDRFTARAAIAALPMNVLANVRFAPELSPAKLAASRERHAGAGIKVYIHVRGDLPPTTIFAGETEPFTSVFTLASSRAGTEFVAFGTDPARIDVHDRSAVQAFLRRFLPGVEVVSTLSHAWHLDPYSLGTWCVMKKGQMTKYLEALREPHGLVHFAGGDFALGWRGFIDGAIESGNRVAHQIIAQLGGRAEPARGETARAPAAAFGAAGDEAPLHHCAVCHPTDPSGAAGVGPNLRGVYGRRAGSDPSYAYSEALRNGGLTWNERELDAFVDDPAAYVPGTRMPFAGIKNDADRAAVIRFLRNLK